MSFEHTHGKNSLLDRMFLGCFQEKQTLQVRALLTCCHDLETCFCPEWIFPIFVLCVVFLFCIFFFILLNSNFVRKLKNSHKAAIDIFHLRITSTRRKKKINHYSKCAVRRRVWSCPLSSDYLHLFKRPRQEGSEMTVVLNWAYLSCMGFTVCLPKRQLNYSEKAITFLKI